MNKNSFLKSFGTHLAFVKITFRLLRKSCVKEGFWLKFKAGPNFNPQAPAGSTLGVHTQYSEDLKQGTNTEIGRKKLF